MKTYYIDFYSTEIEAESEEQAVEQMKAKDKAELVDYALHFDVIEK